MFMQQKKNIGEKRINQFVTKKLCEWAKKSFASKAYEENGFRERIATTLIQQQESNESPSYDIEQVQRWNDTKIK